MQPGRETRVRPRSMIHPKVIFCRRFSRATVRADEFTSYMSLYVPRRSLPLLVIRRFLETSRALPRVIPRA